MTLSRLIATGLGRLAARLEIEGLSIQPVSDPGMEREAYRTARARARVPAVTGFAATAYYRNLAAPYLQGGTDFSGALLFRYDAHDPTTVVAFESMAATGWLVYWLGSDSGAAGRMAWRVKGSAQNDANTADGFLSPGVTYCAAWSWDGTNQRLVVVGSDGSSTAINETPALTYTPSGSVGIGLGSYDSGAAPATRSAILGAAWADATSQSESALLALCNAAIRRGTLRADDLTGCTNLWLAHDLGTDLVGNVDFTEQGTLTKVYVEIGDELTGAFPGNALTCEDQVGSGDPLIVDDGSTQIAFDGGPAGQSVRGARVLDGTRYLTSTTGGNATLWTALKATYTATVWVKLDDATTGAVQRFVTMRGGSGETSGANTLLALGVTATGYLNAFWEHSAGTNVSLTSTGTPLSDGTWHRVDLTVDSSGNVALYLDGAEDATWTGQTLATGGADTYSVAIGSAFGNEPMAGAVYGLMVRDVELSAEAIAAECADGPAEAPNDDVIGFWCVGDNEPARVHCLDLFTGQGAGLTIEESVNIPEAILEARGTQVRLTETADEDLSQVFAWQPDVVRYVDSKIAVGDTSATLLSTSGISVGDIIHAGTEAMIVGGISGSQITRLERGALGTVEQAHWTNGDAEGLAAAIVTNRPLRVRGRRARLYLYGDGDDLQGDGGNGGEPVWRGMVTTEPMLTDSGGRWGIQIGPLTKLFESKLGGELESPARPRGIYYSWACPLRVMVEERGSGGDTYPPVTALFTGFYETQAAFVEAFNAWLVDSSNAVGAAGLASTLTAVVTVDGGWAIEITVGTGVASIIVFVWSLIDGETPSRQGQLLNEDGEEIGDGYSISSGDVLRTQWVRRPFGGGGVPRAYYGEPDVEGGPTGFREDPSVAGTYPETRIYLDKGVSADWSGVTVERPSPFGDSVEYRITTRSTADNWIQIASSPARTADAPADAWRTGTVSQPTISPTRALTRGSLADFRDELVLEGPAYANRGTAPFITSEDLADWTTVIGRAARLPLLTRRFYTIAQPVELAEMLAAEFRLHGVFPITDSTGKIGLAQIGVPNASTASLTTIDEEIVSVAWSSIRRGNQTVNRVVLKTSYNATEDEWGGKREVVDQLAYALDHQDRPLTIEPRSYAAAGRGEGQISAEEAAEIALPVLGLFGYPHDFVEVHVSWKLFELRLGDGVTFSADHLPDYRSGLRPISGVNGIVVGRRWEIGKEHGTLTLLLSWTNVAGYSPTARVTGAANVSGNTWDLTVSPTMYAPTDGSGAVVANADTFFAAGYQVRIVQFDSESPTVVTGEVDSVNTSTHVIRVTFDGTFTPGSATWELGFDAYDATGVTAAQKNYAAIAASDALLGGTDGARTYAP